MKNLRPPLRSKPHSWNFKNPQKQESEIQDKGNFQLYLLAKPEQLKQYYIQQQSYYWVHDRISRDRQFEKYLIELQNQVNVFSFPFVDNLLSVIDKIDESFKIICEVKHLQRIMQFHRNNKKLLSIYIFDLNLKNYPPSKLRNPKIQIQSDNFQSFKRSLYRKKYDKTSYQVFTNATKITNWDLSEVNKSRLVLKTLLVSKNNQKGNQDFLTLAKTVVQKQIRQVYEYQQNYKIDSQPEQVIKEYTKQSFFYGLINNTLKAGKGNPLLLSYIRYPVKQLYNAIKTRYETQKLYKKSFECYRGGMISQAQLNYFRDNKKGFIEMQGFVSCSKNKSLILEFIDNCVFKIKVNNLQRQPQWDHGFALLDSQLTHFVKEQEVLFNIFSVMEIIEVEKEIFGTKVVDVITLQYGSLAAQLYKKNNGLEISSFEKRCINNYEALKPYYESVKNQGDCFQFFNQPKLAQQYYLTVIKYFTRLYNSNISDNLQNNDVFDAYVHLGSVYISLKEFEKAKDYYLKAKNYAEKSENNNNIDTIKLASIYSGLGLTYKNLNKISEAKEYYLKTIQLLSKKRNGKNYLVIAYTNLANLFTQQNQAEQALKYYTRALDLSENENNQSKANILYNIGMLHYEKGNYKIAIDNLEKTLEIYNQTFGTHQQTLNTYFKLGQMYLKNSSYQSSKKSFQSALNIAKQLYGSGFDQRYIKMKRDIENLRLNHKKSDQQRGLSNSKSVNKFQDVLQFVNQKQDLDKIFGFDQKFKSISMIQNPKMQSMSLDNKKFGNDKLRYLRGQHVLNADNLYNVESKIQSKLTRFNQDDFINNLQIKKKNIKLY